MKIESVSDSAIGRRRITWGLPLALFIVLTLNTTVLQVANVVSTTGFVRQVGIEQVPTLWIIDMIITLIATGVYSLVVDRLPRATLMGGLLLSMALVYLGLQALFAGSAPAWLTYPLLYLISDQQFVLFPLAFWALANDLYTTSEAKHVFPIITTGTVAGSLLGNGMTVALASQSTSVLLSLAAVLLLTALAVLWISIRLRRRRIRARQARVSGLAIQETVTTALEFVKSVRSFRYMTAAMLLASISLTILEYHFLATLDNFAIQSSNAGAQFQTIYGSYRLVFFIAIWVFQWSIAGRLLSRIKLQNTFLWLPVTLTLAASMALALPGFWGGAIARFAARLVQRGWEEPARKIFQGLIPDEKRGRISAFMDSYIYAIATIIGCIILIGGLLLEQRLPETLVMTLTLALAGIAGLLSFIAVLKMRQVFEESLLNWRFARSRRKSVLDKIDL
jgi:ATP:ADP antiporter, AAA family